LVSSYVGVMCDTAYLSGDYKSVHNVFLQISYINSAIISVAIPKYVKYILYGKYSIFILSTFLFGFTKKPSEHAAVC